MPKTRALGNGFGHLRGGEVVPGAPLEPDVTGTLEEIARYLKLLTEQYVLDPLLEAHIVNLASGSILRVDSLTRKVGSIIVMVTTGTLDVWWQDNSSVSAGVIPHMEFTAVGAPVQIVLPPAPRIFTLLANGAACKGTFTMSSV